MPNRVSLVRLRHQAERQHPARKPASHARDERVAMVDRRKGLTTRAPNLSSRQMLLTLPSCNEGWRIGIQTAILASDQ